MATKKESEEFSKEMDRIRKEAQERYDKMTPQEKEQLKKTSRRHHRKARVEIQGYDVHPDERLDSYKSMKEVLSKSLNYILHQKGEELYLSVYCSNLKRDYLIFLLNDIEKLSYAKIGEPFIDELASQVRNNQSIFGERSITFPV